ncbi:MAG: hypothetical protein Q7S99_11010 [Parvibaculum sp.]|nr:hypothetical protein [Parvibaculum sp.]
MLDRLRLLPTVMLVAAMLLGLKVVHMIGGLGEVSVIGDAQAQSAPAPAEHGADAAEGDGAKAAEHGAEAAEGDEPQKAHGGGERSMSDVEKQAALDAQTAQLNNAPMSEAEIAVLGSLTARREELDERAKTFEMREQLLSAAEKRVEARIAELKELEARINTQIGASDKANEERLMGVVQMYETMKPKDASRIFERLDMGVLIDVAKRMSPRKLSAVLAVMDPVAAQDLTVELATGDRLPEMTDKAANAELGDLKPIANVADARNGQGG